MTTSAATLAACLDDLTVLIGKAAAAAHMLDADPHGLPPIVRTRHIAKYEGISNVTAWRRAKTGKYGPLIGRPGDPIGITRENFLKHVGSGGG